MTDEDVQKEAKDFGVEGTSLAAADREEKNGKIYLTGRSLSGRQHRSAFNGMASLGSSAGAEARTKDWVDLRSVVGQ
jgi:hypothetical protein